MNYIVKTIMIIIKCCIHFKNVSGKTIKFNTYNYQLVNNTMYLTNIELILILYCLQFLFVTYTLLTVSYIIII